MIAAIPYLPESVVAIIVAVIGTGTTLTVARWSAKRQVVKDAHDDSAQFRGEILDDNKALRAEMRAMKSDNLALEKLIAEKSKENDALRLVNFKQEQNIILLTAQVSGLTAQLNDARTFEKTDRTVRQAADAITEKREKDRTGD